MSHLGDLPLIAAVFVLGIIAGRTWERVREASREIQKGNEDPRVLYHLRRAAQAMRAKR